MPFRSNSVANPCTIRASSTAPEARTITIQSQTSTEVHSNVRSTQTRPIGKHLNHSALLCLSLSLLFVSFRKETILLCQPPPPPPSVVSRPEFQTRTAINGSERMETTGASSQHLLHPSAAAPIITHTAATPQGSPNATLDSICSRRDSSSSCVRLSPLKSVKLVGVSSTRTSAETSPLHGDGINLVSKIAGS